MKLDKVLCCRFLLFFLALTVQKNTNSCLLLTEELTNRNLLVTQSMHSVWRKQKIVQGRGPSNITLGNFVLLMFAGLHNH